MILFACNASSYLHPFGKPFPLQDQLRLCLYIILRLLPVLARYVLPEQLILTPSFSPQKITESLVSVRHGARWWGKQQGTVVPCPHVAYGLARELSNEHLNRSVLTRNIKQSNKERAL